MNNAEPNRIISFAEFELDARQRRLMLEGKPVPLNAKAFDLLVFLAENAGRTVSKNEIMDAVWENRFVEEANLKVQMSALRKVLGEDKDNRRFLVTIPGKGYKFIADVKNGEREIVIESRRISRLLIEAEREEEKREDSAKGRKGEEMINFHSSEWSSASPGLPVNSFTRLSFYLSHKSVIAAFTVLLLAVSLVSYRYFIAGQENPLFGKIKFTRLTNSGKVANAALSPDGKYFAYVLGESDGNSLWIQQVGAAGKVRLLPPVKAQFYELSFTPDGSNVFYSLFSDGNADLRFYRVPTLGGVSEQIYNVNAGFISFAPDGTRLAYAQSDSAAGQNYLVIADADGSNPQKIVTKTQPDTFETNADVVAWSPDGETIACIVNHFEPEASYSSIIAVNVRDSSERVLTERRLYNVFNIEWLRSGGGILISSSEKISGSNQVRLLSPETGELRQISNDLNHYGSLSAAADGESFISIQSSTVNGIFVGETGADASDFREIISETNSLSPFVWTPDGKIIYRSNKDGVSNLWEMDADDGADRRQLTTTAEVDSRGLCLTPDGRYLVFGSWRGGKSNLWRAEAASGDLFQLTSGEADVYPSCSPDNQWVVYQKGLHTSPTLWKVPLAGGEPVRLTESRAKWNALSNDGSRISYFYMADGKWRFGIIPAEGGALLRSLDLPATQKESVIRWSPDDSSLYFISADGSVGNISSLPLDGAPEKQLTNFKSHSIEHFAFSSDQKKLAIARSSTISDVVLVSNTKPE